MSKPEILYEDKHLLVVNKPAGLITQPSGTDQDSLECQCKQLLKIRDQKPGNVYLHAVHRLDKPVSGIVLFAKTSKALSRLNAALRAKNFQKVYLALAEGVFIRPTGILEHYLIHDDFQARVAGSSDPKAKLSRLHYRVLKVEELKSLVEVTLETGRYHQIRAQLAAEGHPIVGDTKYGSQTYLGAGYIALHHCRLSLPHPVTGQVITVESPCPWPGWKKLTNASSA